MAVAFDTLKAATRLQDEAGFNEKQARVLVATFAEGIGENLATKEDVAALRSEMATKEDVAVLRSEMATKEEVAALRSEMATKEDVAALRSEVTILRSEMATKEDVAALRSEVAALRSEMPILRGEMRELEQRMTIRLGVMIAAAVGIIVALDKLL